MLRDYPTTTGVYVGIFCSFLIVKISNFSDLFLALWNDLLWIFIGKCDDQNLKVVEGKGNSGLQKNEV